MGTLANDYPIEQARCRELLQAYQEIPTGWFGAKQIEATLKEADEAAASGDTAKMVLAFDRMKQCE